MEIDTFINIRMHHLVYKITNTINGRYYIGVHSTTNINDSYFGSGKLIIEAVSKYGKENFTKEILYTFETAQEAYDMEFQLVKTTREDSNSYNMTMGGKGGWNHVNTSLRDNSMYNPDVAAKVSKSLKNKFENDLVYRETLLANRKLATLAAAEVNLGKTRPEHSSLMKTKYDSGELDGALVNRLPSIFEVISPSGDSFVVYNLREFCYNHSIPYVTVWNSYRTNNAVKKGKAKGWQCKLIKKGTYAKRN